MTEPVPATADSWTLVWSDEFEGDRLDLSKWDFDVGNGFFDCFASVA